jgi:ferrochelatase
VKTGILLMAYGTPGSRDEIESYYTHIRHGRAPTPELLAELVERYDAIGGSPLAEITAAQIQGVAAELERRDAGEFVVAAGFKHSAPFVEDGVSELNERGVDRAIGLVLAPHYSAYSVGEYAERAQTAAEQLGGPKLSFVQSWHLTEDYLSFLAAAVEKALDELPPAARPEAEVVFTAHSLPERLIIGTGDPYPSQLLETAQAVAERVGLKRFSTAWQSAGRTPDPWIGPDILDHMATTAERGATGIVVCPCGFTADHLEVLFDVDIECAQQATRLGIPFARTESPNAGPNLVAAVADALLEHLAAQPAV